jgi:phage terminase large subunit-like protein
MISITQIEEDLIESAETVVLSEIAKDPWNSAQLGANLQEAGFTVVDIPQQVRYLSEPMKELQALVDEGFKDDEGVFQHRPRFHHDANPAFVWMLSNVEVKEDRNENIFPRKLRAANKIDAAIALIVAMNRSLAAVEESGSSFWENADAS